MFSSRILAPGLLFAAGTAMLAGCQPPPGEELLRQAKALGDERRWEEARALAKQYLLHHPRDVAGHYLLAESYVHVPQDFEIIGRGELLAAHTLFEQSGDLGVLAETMTPQEFQLLYHQESALTYLRSVRRAMELPSATPLLAEHLRVALQHVEDGLAIRPDAHFLIEMKETLTGILGQRNLGQPPANVPLAPPAAPAPTGRTPGRTVA